MAIWGGFSGTPLRYKPNKLLWYYWPSFCQPYLELFNYIAIAWNLA